MMRDMAGSIAVNSGYRSPEYNAGVDGVENSRHLFGDGYDLDPNDVSLDELEGICTDVGGFLVEYDNHVHCDWRDEDLDEAFFGPP